MPIVRGAIVAERFILEREIARGGMGSVWVAKHRRLDVAIAIKFIHGWGAQDAAQRARFEREAKAAALLGACQHVVRILDHGVWEGVLYIAMELLEGETLAERLGRGRLSAEQTTTLLGQVGRALTSAHERSIVHRDIKPANVFIAVDGDREIVKVLDFGIAKADFLPLPTQLGTGQAIMGTPDYMSPEQFAGMRVDWRTDLWSLAVVAFECVTGRRPFGASNRHDIEQNIRWNPLPIPSEAAVDVPRAFDAWWARAATRAPEGRFQSAREMTDALAAALGVQQGGSLLPPRGPPSDLATTAPTPVVGARAAGSSRPVGIEVVRRANEAAREAIEGRDDSGAWVDVLQPKHVLALRHYVGVRLETSNEVAHQRLVRALREASVDRRRDVRVCLVGPAGVGKTTVLLQTWLTVLGARHSALPEPLFFQPREFSLERLRAIDPTRAAKDVVRALVDLWLEKRRADPDEAPAADASLDIVRGLRSGEIALLLDAVDELAVARVQRATIDVLLRWCRISICTARPEVLPVGPEDDDAWTLLRLPDAWPLDLIEDFLVRRWSPPVDVTERIVRRLQSTQTTETRPWVMNPRNLQVLFHHRGLDDGFDAIDLDQSKIMAAFLASAAERLGHTPGELEVALYAVARKQLERGRFTHAPPDDEPWWLGATELLEVRRHADSVDVLLGNYSFVAYVLGREIGKQLPRRERNWPELGLWHDNLLAFVAAELSKGRPSGFPSDVDQILGELLDGCRAPALGAGQLRQATDFEAVAAPAYRALNVLHVLKLGNRPSPRRGDRIVAVLEGWRFDDLNLGGARLARTLFRNCRFDGAFLRGADLDGAVFDGCSFEHANLQHASAVAARFVHCDLGLPAGAPRAASPIQGMILQDARFERCRGLFGPREREPAGAAVVREHLCREHDAVPFKSRYRGLFGRIFDERPDLLLGEGADRAEEAYMAEVRRAIRACVAQREGPVLVVDLMAGGGTRLRSLLDEFGDLVAILAVDRDTDRLGASAGGRLAVIEKVIDGPMDLRALLSTSFRRTEADVIIGKKALHEVPRAVQPALLRELAGCLRPEGQLVLFADAPDRMSEAGARRLERLAAPLRAEIEPMAADLGALFPPALVFAGDEDDAAIFSNLWVLLKDWSCDNAAERRSRYFSSAVEIAAWAGAAGLSVERASRFSYDLQAARFNERGINEIGLLHERRAAEQGPSLVPEQSARALRGSEKHALFCRFATTHLLDTHGQPTALGRALGAETTTTELGWLLTELHHHPLTGVTFSFAVHVLSLRRTGRTGSSLPAS